MLKGGSESASIGNQNMFMAVMIISILGLALFFTFPWISVEKKFEEGKRYTCQDCGYSSEDEDDFYSYSGSDYECYECESNNVKVTDLSGTKHFHFNYDLNLISGEKDEWGDDEFYPSYYGVGKTKSFTKGTIWLSFWGLLFSLVLVIIFMGLQRYRPIHGIFQYYKPLILVIFSMVLLILSLIILTSGLRFMDIKIQELHQEQISQQLGGEVNQHQYHIGGYVMLALGGILLGIAIFTLRRNLKMIQNRFQSQPQQHIMGQPQRKIKPKSFLNTLLLLTVLALIFIPLFPYFGMTRELYKSSADYESDDEKVKVTDFSMGSPFYIEIYSGYSTSSYSNISDDLWAISALTWLSLVFLGIGFIGLAIFTMNRWKFAYVSLFLIAAIGILILAIIAVSYHGLMIKDIYELQNEINDMSSGSDSGIEVIYAYNYFPFIFSLLILIISIFFLIVVVKLSKETYMEYIRTQRTYPYVPPSHTEPYPQRQQASVQPPPASSPSFRPPPPQQTYSSGVGYGVEPQTQVHEYDRCSQTNYEPSPQYPTSSRDFRYDRQDNRYGSETSGYSTGYQQQDLYCPTCNGYLEKSMYGNYCTRCKRYT